MRKSFIYLGIALLLTGILIIYHQLGGFKKPGISYVDVNSYRVAGTYYEGRLSDKAWEDLFYKTRQYIEKGILDGDMAIIWYNEPEKEEGNVKAFVGVIVGKEKKINLDLEIRELKMNGLIRARIDAHSLVMPSPKKINERLLAFASEFSYIPQDVRIEKYPEESLVVAEIPLK